MYYSVKLWGFLNVQCKKYGTCHNKVSDERPLPFIRYARARTCRMPVPVLVERPFVQFLDARFSKVPNQYQKVRIVWYANAINNSLVE